MICVVGMGHVTVEHLETAWTMLNEAENRAEENRQLSAVTKCDDALVELQKAVSTMDKEYWFSSHSSEKRTQIETLEERGGNLNTEEVQELVSELRDLVKETEDLVIPELHTRIEYNPTPSYRS